MKWKQFFTPVKSIDWQEAQKMIDNDPDVLLLDVRQPKEYKTAHVPGSTLIPMGELDDRLSEIELDKPTLIYCASGGRSRVVAQMLSGKGYENLYNVSGGIHAWGKETAIGTQDSGMYLFDDVTDVESAIVIGFGLEEGLREFYLKMVEKTDNEEAKKLFTMLADIEILHQQQLLKIYKDVTGKSSTMEDFSAKVSEPAMEGGLSTDEYISRFYPDLNKVTDILDLAMSIEAQALDLYFRAAEKASDEKVKGALKQIEKEERTHIEKLAEYMDKVA